MSLADSGSDTGALAQISKSSSRGSRGALGTWQNLGTQRACIVEQLSSNKLAVDSRANYRMSFGWKSSTWKLRRPNENKTTNALPLRSNSTGIDEYSRQ